MTTFRFISNTLMSYTRIHDFHQLSFAIFFFASASQKNQFDVYSHNCVIHDLIWWNKKRIPIFTFVYFVVSIYIELQATQKQTNGKEIVRSFHLKNVWCESKQREHNFLSNVGLFHPQNNKKTKKILNSLYSIINIYYFYSHHLSHIRSHEPWIYYWDRYFIWIRMWL